MVIHPKRRVFPDQIFDFDFYIGLRHLYITLHLIFYIEFYCNIFFSRFMFDTPHLGESAIVSDLRVNGAVKVLKNINVFCTKFIKYHLNLFIVKYLSIKAFYKLCFCVKDYLLRICQITLSSCSLNPIYFNVHYCRKI